VFPWFHRRRPRLQPRPHGRGGEGARRRPAVLVGRVHSSSTDTDSKWGTDGSSDKWLNIGDGSYPVVARPTRTTGSGSSEIVPFRAEIGGSAIVTPGTYQTNVVMTAVAL